MAAERHEEKRRVLRAFLVEAITAPSDYDEQLRILRTIDELQGAHVKLIRALMQPPDPNTNIYMGSMGSVLLKRIPGMSAERLRDLVIQLEDLKIAEVPLDTSQTGHGAENTQSTITSYGKRVVRYIIQASS